jgi:hypothetical protein
MQVWRAGKCLFDFLSDFLTVVNRNYAQLKLRVYIRRTRANFVHIAIKGKDSAARTWKKRAIEIDQLTQPA